MWYKVLCKEFKYVNERGQGNRAFKGEVINIQRRSDEKRGIKEGQLEEAKCPIFDNKETPPEEKIEYPDFAKTESELAESQAKAQEDMGGLVTEASQAEADTKEVETITSEDVELAEDILGKSVDVLKKSKPKSKKSKAKIESKEAS